MASGLRWNQETGQLEYAPGDMTAAVPGAGSGQYIDPQQAFLAGKENAQKETEAAQAAQQQHEAETANAEQLVKSDIAVKEKKLNADKAALDAEKAAATNELVKAKVAGPFTQPLPPPGQVQPLAEQPVEQPVVEQPAEQSEIERLGAVYSDPITQPLERAKEVAAMRSGVERKAEGETYAYTDEFLEEARKISREAENEALDIKARQHYDRKMLDAKIIEAMKKPKPPEPSFLNLLGVALGGWLNPGGRNVAWEILNTKLQRQAEADANDRANKLQLLREQRGELADREQLDREHAANKAVFRAQRLEGLKQQFQNDVASGNYRAMSEVKLQEALVGFDLEIGKAVKDGLSEGNALWMKQQALENQRWLAEQRAAAKAGRGGGSGGGKPQSGESAIKGPRTFYNPLTGLGETGETVNKEREDRDRAVYGGIEIVDANGVAHRGLLARSKEDAADVTKAMRDYRNVRQRVQRIAKNMDKVSGFDRLKWGAFAATPEGQKIASEFTQLMVALKDMWNLGAIQKPDMFLLENSMGDNPADVSTWLASKFSGADVRQVLENFQSGSEEQVKNMIMERADMFDIDPGRIKLMLHSVGKDIDEGNEPAPVLTAAEVAAEARTAIESGDTPEINKKITNLFNTVDEGAAGKPGSAQRNFGKGGSELKKFGKEIWDTPSRSHFVNEARRIGFYPDWYEPSVDIKKLGVGFEYDPKPSLGKVNDMWAVEFGLKGKAKALAKSYAAAKRKADAARKAESGPRPLPSGTFNPSTEE